MPSYKVQDKVGSGPTGKLYRVLQPDLDRSVLVKVLSPTLLRAAGGVARLDAVLRTCSRLEHANIVRILDYDLKAAKPHVLREIVEGENLERVMARKKPPALADVLEMVAQVADAVQYGHDNGLVHGDIKPQNVLVTSDGTAVVTDFGVALALVGTKAHEAIPHYPVPGQVAGAGVNEATDLFGLGALLFDLLTGGPPTGGPAADLEVLRSYLHEGTTEALPALLIELVAGCLEVRPELRPDSADQVAVTLRQVVGDVDDERPYRARRARLTGSRRRSRNGSSVTVLRTSSVASGTVPAHVSTQTRMTLIAASIGLLFVALAALLLLRTPSTSEAVGELEILHTGARAALVRWQVGWRASTATLLVSEQGKDEERETTVRPLTQPGPKDEPPFAYTARLTSLEPSSAYTVSLKAPDGSRSLARAFSTGTGAAFEPVRKIALDEASRAVVTVEARTPFSLRLSPEPETLLPQRVKGRPTFAGKHVGTYLLSKLARDPVVQLRARTIDGDEEQLDVDLAAYLRKTIGAAADAYEADRKSGTFAAVLNGPEQPTGKLLRTAGRKRKAHIGKGEKPAAEAVATECWKAVLARLRRASWYVALEPLLPGLARFSESPLCSAEFAQLVCRARVPVALVQRAAQWYELPPHEPWEPFLAPEGQPHPIGYGKPFLPKPLAVRPFSVVALVDQDFYLMFDRLHPKFKSIFSNPLMADMVTGQTMSLDLEGVDLTSARAAELELAVRTAVLPAVIVVNVNKGRFFAIFEDRTKDVRAYDEWRRETGANVREVAMMIRGDFGKKDKIKECFETIESGLPDEPRKLYHRLPLSCLGRRHNRIAVYPISSPIDSLEYVAVTSVSLRLSR